MPRPREMGMNPNLINHFKIKFAASFRARPESIERTVNLEEDAHVHRMGEAKCTSSSSQFRLKHCIARTVGSAAGSARLRRQRPMVWWSTCTMSFVVGPEGSAWLKQI